MAPPNRLLVRQRESRVILEHVDGLFLRQLHPALPQSAFGKALHYPQDQWPKHIRYGENGARPISNNACEHAI
ncbi:MULTISPECIES: IS66 family transposase [Burkholderia]|uniref:IS66 family transposase n=1 Tax=Burkholderia TaxID=32008 RepID=UPI00158BAFC2|nr:transposase [Burkholderia ambifaria]